MFWLKQDLLCSEELDKEPSTTVRAISEIIELTTEVKAIIVLDEDRVYSVQESAFLEHRLVLELETHMAKQELKGVLVEGKLLADKRQRVPATRQHLRDLEVF